jgi:hypothetical protein
LKADELQVVFDEDVNSFVEDQLHFACRLALAEEQLLTVAHSFKNSMSAKQGAPGTWLDDLHLISSVEEVKAATKAVGSELEESLCRLRDHKSTGSRNGASVEQVFGDGGKSLKSHLDAFHQESAIERNARADLQAQWVQFQKDMRRDMDERMQTLETRVEKRLAALEQGHGALVVKVNTLEREVLNSKGSSYKQAEGLDISLAVQEECSKAFDRLRDTLTNQVLVEVSGTIEKYLKEEMQTEAGSVRAVRAGSNLSAVASGHDSNVHKGFVIEPTRLGLLTPSNRDTVSCPTSPRLSAATTASTSTSTGVPRESSQSFASSSMTRMTPMAKVKAGPKTSSKEVSRQVPLQLRQAVGQSQVDSSTKLLKAEELESSADGPPSCEGLQG